MMKYLLAVLLLTIAAQVHAAEQMNMKVTGDSSRTDGDTVITTGNARIEYRGVVITADRVDYTKLRAEAVLYRKVEGGEFEVVGMFVTE